MKAVKKMNMGGKETKSYKVPSGEEIVSLQDNASKKSGHRMRYDAALSKQKGKDMFVKAEKGSKIDKYMGGGKTPMYMYGGKVVKGAEGLITALAKDPKNRAKMKKALGMD